MSVLVLKIIACAAMLIDHIGYWFNFLPFRIIGRIAFPIFLYLICNGYRYTSDKRRYAFRLLVFALISQVPFSLFCYNTVWSDNGNVMFTLLIALLCVWSADVMIQSKILRWFSMLPSVGVFFLYHFGVLSSDYGARAIIMAMVFFLFDGKKPVNRIFVLLGYIFALFYSQILSWILHIIMGDISYVPQWNQWTVTQIWSLMALPMIFLYNGKKGNGSKWSSLIQYGFYAFYPAHQLILWCLRQAF